MGGVMVGGGGEGGDGGSGGRGRCLVFLGRAICKIRTHSIYVATLPAVEMEGF